MVAVSFGAWGCGTTRAHSRRVPAAIVQGHHGRAPSARAARAARKPSREVHQKSTPIAVRPGHESAAFVAGALRQTGLRFGTDGTTGALWGYMSQSHQLIAPAAARPGDVLFFDTRADPDDAGCADHAALVAEVEPDGRIVFAEVRDGAFRKSVVDPVRPTVRRNERGEIANSFLRAKTIDDPPGARYFAGEMLCGVVRVTPTK